MHAEEQVWMGRGVDGEGCGWGRGGWGGVWMGMGVDAD